MASESERDPQIYGIVLRNVIHEDTDPPIHNGSEDGQRSFDST